MLLCIIDIENKRDTYSFLNVKKLNELDFLCVFKVHIPGLEELQVFVPHGLMEQRLVILQLLNAAAGKDCSKELDEIPEDEAYLFMSKHGVGESNTGGAWADWDGSVLKLVPQMETVDTLRAMKV